MSGRRRWGGAALLTTAALGLVVAVAPTAQASTGTIDKVVISGSQVRMTLTAKGLPAGALTVNAGANVHAGGLVLPVTATTVGGHTTAQLRTTILLVDESGSMSGAGIAGARAAGEAFVADVAPDVRVGLVGFSDHATVLVKPTADRVAVRAGLSRLIASGETALYDALITADAQLGSSGERRVLLLSDGADTKSTASVQAAIARLQHDHVRVDAVSFRTASAANAALEQLTTATAGVVLQASDSAQLAAAFATVAHHDDQQISIGFTVPSSLLGQRLTMTVTVPTSAGTLTGTTTISLPSAASPTPSAAATSAEATPAVSAAATATETPAPAASSSQAALLGSGPSSNAARPGAVSPSAAASRVASGPFDALYRLSPQEIAVAAAAVGGAIFLLLVLAFDIGMETSGRHRTIARIRRFSMSGKGPAQEAPAVGLRETAVARTVLELSGRILNRRDPEQKLRLLLDRAAIPIRPSEWLLVLAGGSAVATILLSALSGNLLVGLLVGAPLGAGLPHLLARLKAGRRKRAFLAALPDALQLTAGSLATGYSLLQALDTIVRQGADPIAGEVGRALAQARLGIPIEDALQEMAERMQSEDLEWVVMAIRINREVGGNLSEVLGTVARTLREREQLRRHVQALSAEGRLSAYVLVAMPLGVAAFLFAFRRPYIRPLYTQTAGIIMLAAAGVLVVTGALWMRSLVKVEV